MYYQTEETINEYIKLSKGYDSSELIKILRRYLPKGNLLELGSGSGNDIFFLQDYYNLTASDFSPFFIEYIKLNYPNVKVELIDAKSCESNNKYDGIFSNKVLQHLTKDELIKSLSCQMEILNEGGIICHSFWAGDGYEFTGDIIHQYYTKDELDDIISENYRVLYLDYYNEMSENDSLLVIAQLEI